jgi:spermidine synthase
MADSRKLDIWVKEVYKGIMALSFRVEDILFSGSSRYQDVDIVKTDALGNMLLNDGMIMLSEKDEFIYHEMISHPALFTHPNPERVLIIGGGDGGTAREVLRHPGVKRVVMVEIDALVVEASRKYLPTVSCALDDPRLEIIIDDGVKYVASAPERFDVVLIDSTDPVGPAAPLFDSDFYRDVAGILTDDGILITQAESPFYDAEIQRQMFGNQRPFFKKLHLYLLSNFTYPGGLWSLGFASKRYCPLNDFNPARFKGSGISTRYYNPQIHRAAFCLPTYIKDNLKPYIDPVGE